MTRGLLIILFVILHVAVFSQSLSIRGVVFDAESNTPLPGANVFIAKTTHGTSTNAEGVFELKGLREVHYQLVVSFIGYESQVFDIVPGRQVSYKILLQPSAKTLKEVVINSRKMSRSQWIENFNMFKEYFIGLSENYRHCTFENPRILQFTKENGKLTATADSMLYLENRGLGYRVKILLEKYEFNIISHRVHYEGQIVYEALEPDDDKEAKHWAKNRLKAYYGSEMHFLRALYKQTLNDEGYYYNIIDPVTHSGMADTLMTPRTPIFNDRRIKVFTINNYNRVIDSLSSVDQPLLKFNGELEIQYILESEPYNYQVKRKQPQGTKPQLSNVILHTPAIVQPHGQVYPQDAIETRGYWSWELMAESLPLDYEPDNDLLITSENE